MAGHDINYLALAGALHAVGTADTPVPPLNLLGDYGGGGMLLAVGILSAILECRQSGVGQVVDVAMFDGAAMLMTVFYGLFAEGRWEDRRQANVIDGAAHYYRDVRDRRREALRGRRDGAAVLRGVVRSGSASTCRRRTRSMHGPRTATRWRRASARRRGPSGKSELVTPQSCASPVLGLAEAPDHPHSRAAARSSRSTVWCNRHRRRASPGRRRSEPSSPSLPGDHTLAVLAELGLGSESAELLETGVARQSAAG